jgi:hypothetical protein
VQTLASLQLSSRQKAEQPSSQLCGGPAVSQVSGNSVTPLPQVGHGTRHEAWPAAVQVASAVTTGAGAMVPPSPGARRLG